MRTVLVILGICTLFGTALAEKPEQDPIQSAPDVECDFVTIDQVVNFGSDNGGGIAPNRCDPGGGAAVWQWGVETIIPPPPPPFGPNMWGTVIGANYPIDSGDGFMSQPFVVTAGVNELVELVHYLDIETNYDGGNVVVVEQSGAETILIPLGGYPATISTSTSYHAWCVDEEDGFTGHVNLWTTECADLTPWDGQTIQLRADFGSDSSVTYPGWYIAGFTLGSGQAVPVDQSTWGSLKNVYR
jgi:hypothetical protein